MTRSKLPRLFTGLLCLMLVGIALPAGASIAVDSSYFVGSRATIGITGDDGGLIWNPAAGSWSSGGFKLSWVITDNGSDFTYKYTIDTSASKAPGGDLSHWLLELSGTDVNGNSLDSYWVDVFNTPGLPGPGAYTDSGIKPVPAADIAGGADDGASNTDIPGPLYGVKFTGESVAVTWVQFTTPQVPIWGDFYARDGAPMGNTIYAYNKGFGTDPADDATVFTNWIPRPDGVARDDGSVGGGAPGVPEPLSLAVWGLLIGICGLILGRQSRMN